MRSKAFLLYFAKPIGTWEYLGGKLCVPLFFICGITLFPALALYAISIALSPDANTLLATAPIVGRIVFAFAGGHESGVTTVNFERIESALLKTRPGDSVTVELRSGKVPKVTRPDIDTAG